MKYWDEYESKWGFGDGDSIPPDAYACRLVYVREINKLAVKYKSKVRALAWDRAGLHNCYLICFIEAAKVKRVKPAKLCTGDFHGGYVPKEPWNEATRDAGMDKAVRKAFDMDLDSLVETRVKIRK